jgi:hypothetical protein
VGQCSGEPICAGCAPAKDGTTRGEACLGSTELTAAGTRFAGAISLSSLESMAAISFVSGLSMGFPFLQLSSAKHQRLKTTQRFNAAARRSQPEHGRIPIA